MTRNLTLARSAILVALAVLIIGADEWAPARDICGAIAPDELGDDVFGVN